MVVDQLGGRHPSALIADGHSDEFISRMDARLGQIAGAFGTRPVAYRTMDFRSNEFRGLTGGEQFEPVEQNPMIDYRRCCRYIKDAETFALELETLGRVRQEFPNLQVMIPFVKTQWELEACLEAVAGIEHTVTACCEVGITSSLCELSVTTARRVRATAERRLLLDAART